MWLICYLYYIQGISYLSNPPPPPNIILLLEERKGIREKSVGESRGLA